MKPIYWDTAAATVLDPAVKKVMGRAARLGFANPSSLHTPGVAAKAILEEARRDLARLLGAHADEIIFTSGGTESNNLALSGVLKNSPHGHLVVSAIEHPSILEPARQLTKAGYSLTVAPVDKFGTIDLVALEKSLTAKTKLVSVIMASNEIGTIQPIKEVAKVLRHWSKTTGNPRPLLHTDACQAGRFLEINVESLGVDLLTLNAAKMYGPRGIGLLYVRRGVKLEPSLFGGGQEVGRRSGTESPAAAAGFAAALALSARGQKAESKRLTSLRDYFWREVKKIWPDAILNGHPTNRLPHHLNISLLGFSAEELVLRLDAAGLAVSAGSACATNHPNESYVIIATGQSKAVAESAIRLTLDRHTTKSDAVNALKIIKTQKNFYVRNW